MPPAAIAHYLLGAWCVADADKRRCKYQLSHVLITDDSRCPCVHLRADLKLRSKRSRGHVWPSAEQGPVTREKELTGSKMICTTVVTCNMSYKLFELSLIQRSVHACGATIAQVNGAFARRFCLKRTSTCLSACDAATTRLLECPTNKLRQSYHERIRVARSGTALTTALTVRTTLRDGWFSFRD